MSNEKLTRDFVIPYWLKDTQGQAIFCAGGVMAFNAICMRIIDETKAWDFSKEGFDDVLVRVLDGFNKQITEVSNGITGKKSAPIDDAGKSDEQGTV